MVQQLMQGEEESDGDSSDDNPEVLLRKLEEAGIKTPEAAKFKEAKQKQAQKASKVNSELLE